MAKNVNKHTQELFKYIFYAPEEIQKKYYNGIAREITYRPDLVDENGAKVTNSNNKIRIQHQKVKNKEWYRYKNNKGDCSFYGFIFKDNRVFVYNIYLYDKNNDYKPEYLEITGIFNKLLKRFNIYHLCIILNKALKNQCKENETTESIIIFLKHDNKNYHHRYRYQLLKQNGRYKEFIIRNRHESRIKWNKIIFSAITKTSEYYVFGKLRTERPNSFYFTYLPHTKEERLCILTDIQNNSIRVRRPYARKGERKKRRRFDAFNS